MSLPLTSSRSSQCSVVQNEAKIRLTLYPVEFRALRIITHILRRVRECDIVTLFSTEDLMMSNQARRRVFKLSDTR